MKKKTTQIECTCILVRVDIIKLGYFNNISNLKSQLAFSTKLKVKIKSTTY